MSEPAQARSIPVGVLVSVSAARARARSIPPRKPPERTPHPEHASCVRWLSSVQDLPWYAFVAVGVALWSTAFVGFACFAKMPEPQIAQTPPAQAFELALVSDASPAETATIDVPPATPAEEIPITPAPNPEPMPEPSQPSEAAPAAPGVAEASAERRPASEEPLAKSPVVPQKPPVCAANLGTQITFIKNPVEAFQRAKEEKKLVFLIHLSGNFEATEFT